MWNYLLGKSSSTLFTLWTREVNHHLDIVIDNRPVPVVKNPKILGVTFDPLSAFNIHTSTVKSKLVSRNNVFKSLSGSTWGNEKATLALTYKTLGGPFINYAATIFAPQICDTNWTSLQRAKTQRSAR